ncbi:MAG: YicC/YloC family endoribonuclease [Thermodesulfobacteriota bacterium]
MTRPLSMTSFGRGEYKTGKRTWTAEVRSVNHRFCDIKIRIPRKYGALEEKIKKEISAAYSRAHIDVNISYSGEEQGAVQLKTDLDLARQYHDCLKSISRELALDSEPDLSILSGFREIITVESQEEDLDEIWNSGIRQALQAALEECRKMREAEGSNLKQDLQERLSLISGASAKIEEMFPQLQAEKKTALEERLANLLNGVEIDQARLAQEVALLADKADVTEELVRLKSHISQFGNFLELDEPVGRRLDFLLQEFLREINTLASKISSAQVAHLAVELKNELEKMREQVQNLE